MHELDPSHWYQNVGRVPDASFCPSRTISKDPRNCSSVFFHSGKYFDSVCIFGRDPCVVMPILHYNMLMSDAASVYGNRKTVMGDVTMSEVTRNEANRSFQFILHILLKNMLRKVNDARCVLRAEKKSIGRLPTPGEQRSIHISLTQFSMGM